jgi:hypothetical protein
MQKHAPITWAGMGYAEYGLTLRDAEDSPSDAWQRIERVMAEARAGRFGRFGSLVPLILDSDPVLQDTACAVLADGGSAKDLEAMVLALERDELFYSRLSIAQGLALRGRLVDVPALFAFHETNLGQPEAKEMISWLEFLLCEADDALPPAFEGKSAFEDYRRAVADRYHLLWTKLGTNLIHVYRGAPLSLERVVQSLLRGARAGRVSLWDRHLFEAMTGAACHGWFVNRQFQPLTATAALEAFIDDHDLRVVPPGQRTFLGHPLEDVEAARHVLAAYPPQHGLGVPSIRSVFNRDEYFALKLGFWWLSSGYFYDLPAVPPSVTRPPPREMPWLALAVSVRDAKLGRREGIGDLNILVETEDDEDMSSAALEFLADAAPDHVLDAWRARLATEPDAAVACNLCRGLVRRGYLGDVPSIVVAFHAHADDPDFEDVREGLDRLFAIETGSVSGSAVSLTATEFTSVVLARHAALARQYARATPLFRGGVFSVRAVVEAIARLADGEPVREDLRYRLEANTGIDGRTWGLTSPSPELVLARAKAREFLDAGRADTYAEGELYFFGQRVEG